MFRDDGCITLRELYYFVEWRPIFWAPAVKWLIGDPKRFSGKRVLEIGCRSGRMSCLFGLLGAEVTGVELPNVSLTMARKEVERWNLVDRVTLVNYSGNPADIPGHEYDFIFTKSVLVVIPYLESFVREVSKKMKSGGEFIAAENLKGGHMLRLIRYLLHPKWQRQYGVDSHFIDVFNRVFKDVQVRRYWGLVAAIRAQK